MREHAEGPRKTTGSTGRVRKAREGLSRPVLIGRAACPLRPPPIRDSGTAGGADTNLFYTRRALRRAPAPPSARPSVRFFRLRLPILLWPVALAGLSHPFPSRTRTLRAPAAMVLRPGAWESSAPPVFFPGPRASHDEARGPFSSPRGAEAARLHAFCAARRPRVSMPLLHTIG